MCRDCSGALEGCDGWVWEDHGDIRAVEGVLEGIISSVEGADVGEEVGAAE